jgi:hypothetical protein
MRRLFAALALAAGVSATGLASPATAERAAPQRIDMVGHLTGPNSTEGTWTSTGLVTAAGSYTEQFQIVGDRMTLEKTLIGADGSRFVLRARTTVTFSGCTATFQGGFWWMIGQTRDHRRVVAGGFPATTPGSFGDVCTGVVRVSHVGFAATEDDDD